MKIAVFAKTCTTRDGRAFTVYVSTLTKTQTGEGVPVTVKFKADDVKPDVKDCPMYIEIDSNSSNLSKSYYTSKDGESRAKNVLWVGNWSKSADVWRDTSLDEFIEE